jgi:site-specific DNA-methyltransferase (adenine-specific)
MADTDLIVRKLEPVIAALAECKDAPQAKQIVDLARAAVVYAKRQRLSREAITYATSVEIDSMTLLGECLRRTPANPGTRGQPLNAGPGRGHKGKTGGAKQEPPVSAIPKLSEINISKKESSDAQALARLKKEAPKLHEQVRSCKITVAKARAEIRKKKKRQELEEKAAKAPPSPPPDIRCGDVLEVLKGVESASVNLVFADPPYNIGVDYGEGAKADRLPDAQYLEWCRQWINACASVLTDDGSLWLLVSDEYADHFGILLRESGLHRRAWIKWYETFGVNCSNNFNRCSRHLFYCVKNPRKFTFNGDAVTRSSDRQDKYDDARANPDGKLWDDVWGIKPPIPRLVGTAKECIEAFPTQLPLALLRPIIGCSSNPGDLVLDPFSGSATTGVIAAESGRRFIGIEKQAHFVDLSIKRLRGTGNG